MRQLRLVIAVMLVLAPAAHAAVRHLEPLVIGWEQYFTLDWEAAERKGRPIVRGQIANSGGRGARKIQLLVEGLDAAGVVTSQTVAWLGQSLSPGTRSYFEVPVPARAPAYRVRVFAFDSVSGNTSQ